MGALGIIATFCMVGAIAMFIQSGTLRRASLAHSQPSPAELLWRFRTARDAIALALCGAFMDCIVDASEGDTFMVLVRVILMGILIYLWDQWDRRIRKMQHLANF